MSDALAQARASEPGPFISAGLLTAPDLHAHLIEITPEVVAAEEAHRAKGGMPQSTLAFHAHEHAAGHAYVGEDQPGDPWSEA